MKILLVQHGEAETKEVSLERPLTKKGREDSTKTAEFLKESGIKVDTILHSTKKRSIETAQIFAAALKPKNGVHQKDELEPDDPVYKIFSEIIKSNKDLMIVGHLPFLQKLVSLALLNDESYEIVKFSMGGVVCLDQNEYGRWQLVFYLSRFYLP